MGGVHQIPDISAICAYRRIQNFCETGCEYGGGLKAAKEMRLRLFSCDINSRAVDYCKNAFPSATIRKQRSIEFLAWYCAGDLGPTLFWLDAHRRGKGGKQQKMSPLMKELALITGGSRPHDRDIVAIDDLGHIVNWADGCPNPLRKLWQRHSKNAYAVTEHTVMDMVDVLAPTHTTSAILPGDGRTSILLALPIKESVDAPASASGGGVLGAEPAEG